MKAISIIPLSSSRVGLPMQVVNIAKFIAKTQGVGEN
jgi:hypothetical protein